MNISQFVRQQSEATLLPENLQEDLVESMTIYVGAGLDETSAFDKAWSDVMSF